MPTECCHQYPCATAAAMEGAEGASQGRCPPFLPLEVCVFPQLDPPAGCELGGLQGPAGEHRSQLWVWPWTSRWVRCGTSSGERHLWSHSIGQWQSWGAVAPPTGVGLVSKQAVPSALCRASVIAVLPLTGFRGVSAATDSWDCRLRASRQSKRPCNILKKFL